jgi:hypothetical protein
MPALVRKSKVAATLDTAVKCTGLWYRALAIFSNSKSAST